MTLRQFAGHAVVFDEFANEGRVEFRPLVERGLPFVGGLVLHLVGHQFS